MHEHRRVQHRATSGTATASPALQSLPFKAHVRRSATSSPGSSSMLFSLTESSRLASVQPA
eukprot:2149188-Pleurochrysis_carterae.AAC.1